MSCLHENQKRPALRLRTIKSFVLLACIGCGSSSDTPADVSGMSAAEIEELRPKVVATCGACHNAPPPSSFPKDAWGHEVQLGFDFYYRSSRTDIPKPPPMTEVVRWFRTQAPAALETPLPRTTPSPVAFRHTSSGYATGFDRDRMGVSHIQFARPEQGRPTGRFYVCDMSTNEIRVAQLQSGSLELKLLTTAAHPAHLEEVLLSPHQPGGYVIAELGSFKPEDHAKGLISWLRPNQQGELVRSVLLQDVGRVADVQAGDFDGDGDVDLVAAVFGWRATGSLLFLRQTSVKDGVPQFDAEVLDQRHGAIHVPTVDLDADGDLDFVTLFAQEHEEISAYLNRGDGTFERQIIHLAGDPAYGSSGIQLVDLDQDGDVDVLFTNGDSLDSFLIKPYHSVQWLENTGDFPFRHHHIAQLPGASRALAEDLDGDGDLDIAAVAWIPPDVMARAGDKAVPFDTLVWYEQRQPRQFEGHSLLRMKQLGFMALNLGDLDADGDADLIVGGIDASTDSADQVHVFFNDGRQQAK